MFWLALAAQLATPESPANSTQSNPDIDITVERLPAVLTSPALVRVKLTVGADGKVTSCDAGEDSPVSHPGLVRIACAQIGRGYKGSPAKDASGKPIPLAQTAVVRFSTDRPSPEEAQPARDRPPYRGGPLDGIYVGEVMRPDNGLRFIGLKPSKPNASPVPEIDRPAVQAFVDAFARRDLSRLNGYLTADAKSQNCPHGFYSACGPKRPISALKVSEDCTFNTPYYLGDHLVRLEWLYRGALWYWSEVYLKDGKIRLVVTHPADMPPGRF